jgi:hypothetical protein
MPALIDRRVFVLSALAAVGCGTILHPERRGQEAGKLDWKIVGLDALGLLLFFIPGVIAFAVDFGTGAIYLPADQCADTAERVDHELATVRLPHEELTPHGIAAAVNHLTGQTVELKPGRFRSSPLKKLAEFWPTRAALQSVPA